MSLDKLFFVAEQWISNGFAIKRVLDILGLNRSTYYERRRGKKVSGESKRGRPYPGYSKCKDGSKVPDEQIEEYLMEFHFDDNIGALGYKKWTSLLRSEYDLIINKKKVYRLCEKLGILKDRKIKQSKYPVKLAKNRIITSPNQLWQVDIKYGNIVGTSYFVFVCCAIDVFDRSIVGVYRGPSCRAKDITTMLTKALIRRRIHFKEEEYEEKLIIRTDNGPQFVCDMFADFCHHQKIHHERIPKKTPNMNAYIESFHSSLQRECFNRHEFTFYDEAYYYIDQYIDFYNNIRPHGSLNNYPPMKYNELVLSDSVHGEAVSL